MNNWQYQRLVGVIFIVGAGCAQSSWGALFFVIGVVALIESYFHSRGDERRYFHPIERSDAESHSDGSGI